MSRNLDMTALRAFATIAETGSVTRAAGLLHLTQSAVSMQLKRLEDALGRQLFERAGRGLALTADGEQLLGYARRILRLNDEVWARFTNAAYEGEITLGLPHDLVYPALPPVLHRFHADYPRMKVTLISSFTEQLKHAFAQGQADIILTTEDSAPPGSRTLATVPLVWVGALGGTTWRARPLRLAFERRNIFRAQIEAALDTAEIPWEMAVTSEMSRTIEASVSADLAVHATPESAVPQMMEQIAHGGALPELGVTRVNLYVADTLTSEAERALVTYLTEVYGA